jgi:hypothetical protein
MQQETACHFGGPSFFDLMYPYRFFALSKQSRHCSDSG